MSRTGSGQTALSCRRRACWPGSPLFAVRRGLSDHEAGELAIALAAGDRALNADGGAAQPALALTDVESIEVKRLV